MQTPQTLATPQPFQMSPPPTMGHPPMSPPGTQPILMNSCTPMGASPPSVAAGPPPMGLSNSRPHPPPLGGAGFQQPPAPQGFPPQQTGESRLGIKFQNSHILLM